MKAVIVYHSSHHGNTRKLVEAIARGRDVTLVDASAVKSADLSGYELIVLEFAKNNLPEDRKVFFLSTYGGRSNTKAIEEVVKGRSAQVVGQFGCKGYDTFGPFKLVGGICKGRPDENDLNSACHFFDGLS